MVINKLTHRLRYAVKLETKRNSKESLACYWAPVEEQLYNERNSFDVSID